MTAPFRSAAFKLTCIYLFVWFKFLARASVSLFFLLLCSAISAEARSVPFLNPVIRTLLRVLAFSVERASFHGVLKSATHPLSLSLTYSLARCVLQRVPAVEKKTQHTRAIR